MFVRKPRRRAGADVSLANAGDRDVHPRRDRARRLHGRPRLALVDAMYPKEKRFLVLDDPFVNLDEEKMAHGNELFGKISGEYQILYFTCHASRNIENTK